MNKTDLIDHIAKQADISKAAAARALEAVIGGVKATLKKNNSVSLVGFGTFTVSKRAARTGRNPRTGAAIKIKAAKVPKFRPGDPLPGVDAVFAVAADPEPGRHPAGLLSGVLDPQPGVPALRAAQAEGRPPLARRADHLPRHPGRAAGVGGLHDHHQPVAAAVAAVVDLGRHRRPRGGRGGTIPGEDLG